MNACKLSSDRLPLPPFLPRPLAVSPRYSLTRLHTRSIVDLLSAEGFLDSGEVEGEPRFGVEDSCM